MTYTVQNSDGSQGEFVRDALRAKTRVIHEQLHHHESFLSLLSGSLDIADYERLINRLHGFYLPLDRAILSHLKGAEASESGFVYATRSNWLEQDINALGSERSCLKAQPLCVDVAQLVTDRTIGGVLYVIEGALLGGARIDRAAKELLPDENADGRMYWAWCRAQAKHRWPMTVEHLGHLYNQGISIEDLAQGAMQTFHMFADWISPLAPAKKLAS